MEKKRNGGRKRLARKIKFERETFRNLIFTLWSFAFRKNHLQYLHFIYFIYYCVFPFVFHVYVYARGFHWRFVWEHETVRCNSAVLQKNARSDAKDRVFRLLPISIFVAEQQLSFWVILFSFLCHFCLFFIFSFLLKLYCGKNE